MTTRNGLKLNTGDKAMTRKAVEKLAGQLVVLVTVYDDQFLARVVGNSGRWCFEADCGDERLGKFDRSEMVEYHPL